MISLTDKERKQLALYMWRTGSTAKEAYNYANKFKNKEIDITKISHEYAKIGR